VNGWLSGLCKTLDFRRASAMLVAWMDSKVDNREIKGRIWPRLRNRPNLSMTTVIQKSMKAAVQNQNQQDKPSPTEYVEQSHPAPSRSVLAESIGSKLRSPVINRKTEVAVNGMPKEATPADSR
jgi:hypothetical protein